VVSERPMCPFTMDSWLPASRRRTSAVGHPDLVQAGRVTYRGSRHGAGLRGLAPFSGPAPRRLRTRHGQLPVARGSAGLGMGPAEAFRRHSGGRRYMGLDLGPGGRSLAGRLPTAGRPLGTGR